MRKKRRRGHGWSKRRKSTASRSCEVVTKKPPVPTQTPRSCEVVTKKPPVPTQTPTPFEVVTKNIHVPKPTPKHETKRKRKKKCGNGRSRGGNPTPSRSCEVETNKIRYQFFRCSYPINSLRPTSMRQIKLSESLGAPIYELLTSNKNGDFDNEIRPTRCSCRKCPYITGDHHHQIRLLLHRLHELLYDN